MSDNKNPVIVNLSDRELKVLEEMCQKKDMSKSAVMRHALRIFQIVDIRLSKGERLIFELVGTGEQSELMVL